MHSRSRLAQVSRRLIPSRGSPSICPSCAFTQSLTVQRQHDPTRASRNASSLASSTAINATKDIPAKLKELHTALDGVRRRAPSYVNLSRLQLAQQGLESSRPTLRIAVLGLRGQRAARKLVRLLVADALSTEEAWEKRLVEVEANDQRSLLLRYGDSADIQPVNQLTTTIHIPSPALKRLNLEILVSSLNISPHAASPPSLQEIYELALAPTAETPKSFHGAVSYVLYPVHKAVIVADGLRDCLMTGQYFAASNESSGKETDAVQIALNLPGSLQSTAEGMFEGNVALLNMEEAEKALGKFRESTSNGTVYERGWFASGLPSVTKWLAQGTEGHEASISPAVADLTRAVLDEASINIVNEQTSRRQELAAQLVPQHIRRLLSEATQAWATQGHTELRDQLDIAFASNNWAKLRWYKLLWRVDDVSMFTSEVLERNWLVQSEKGLIWLAGRGTEAGVFDAQPSGYQTSTLGAQGTDDGFESLRTEGKMPVRPSDAGAAAAAAVTRPWPTEISTARATLQATTVPMLQSMAQALVVQSISITTVTAALSGLLFASGYASNLYEAGAVAALGLVWSLRRLQKRWEQAKERWEAEIREAGRVVLKDAEGQIQSAIQNGGQAGIDVEGDEERVVAMAAVEGARGVLDEVRTPAGRR